MQVALADPKKLKQIPYLATLPSDIGLESSVMAALKEAQDAFVGEAERLGLKTEQDVVQMIKEVRKATWEEHNEGND